MNLIKFEQLLIIIAGFVWGLSGFTVEIAPDKNLQSQLIVRLFFVLISASLLLPAISMKINKDYLIPAFLFTVYIVLFSISILINEAPVSHIFREVLLLTCAILIMVLHDKKKNLDYFINGIFYSLILLCAYYMYNMQFGKLFSPFYRLTTNLNANGIGMMATMLFVISMYKFLSFPKKIKAAAYLVLVLSALLIIIATKSRTALISSFLSFLFIIYFLRYKKLLIITIMFSAVFLIFNLKSIDPILRISTPEGYKGKQKITNLTGRLDAWEKGFGIIAQNPIWGVGPEKALVKIENRMVGFHNAYIQSLVSIGFIVFLPILVLLMLAIKNIILLIGDTFYKVLFLTGFLGSFVEEHFLNFGSPANLLFFISFIYFARVKLTNLKKSEKGFG